MTATASPTLAPPDTGTALRHGVVRNYIAGRGSIEFWTRTKKTPTKWDREAGTSWMP